MSGIVINKRLLFQEDHRFDSARGGFTQPVTDL